MKAVFALAPVVAVALATPALAAPVAMEELVGRALTQSPTLQSARASAEAQQSREGVARSTYWPQLNLTSGLAQTTNLSPSQTSTQPISLLNTGVAVRQTLWTFGKLDAAVDQAEAQTEALRRQAQLTAVDVAWGVRQAYLNWAQAAGLETQAAEQVRYADATLAEARARFKAGVAARLDVTRAEATLALNRATLAAAKATTAQARRSLAAAIGQTAPVEGEPTFPATPPLANRPIAELEAEAADHPDLLVGQAQLAQAAAATRAAEVAGLPDINADGSYGIRARDFQGAPNWQAGVSLNWPLFTGFAVTSQAEATRGQEAAVRATLEARRLTILRDVDNAYLGLEGAKDRVPAAKTAVDAARANLTQAQGRYRAGVGSIIEVADAQALVASAQADWVRAVTSYHLAIADLQRAMGVTGVPQ